MIITQIKVLWPSIIHVIIGRSWAVMSWHNHKFLHPPILYGFWDLITWQHCLIASWLGIDGTLSPKKMFDVFNKARIQCWPPAPSTLYRGDHPCLRYSMIHGTWSRPMVADVSTEGALLSRRLCTYLLCSYSLFFLMENRRCQSTRSLTVHSYLVYKG